MSIRVHLFPCLSDNYGFLVLDEASGQAAAIDAPEAAAVMQAAETTGWPIRMILNTHWHADHTGGNSAVKAATGCTIIGPEEVRRTAPLDRVVAGGDAVHLGDTRFDVFETGGHTLGHISYHAAADEAVFVGDTLFALGCGRLFEGSPEQMWASLERLAQLPDPTRVFCAHEYTAANARFAVTVDDSPAVRDRAEAVLAARDRGEPTVPTTIGLEKATNPFLRASLLQTRHRRPGTSPAAAFAQIRAEKDAFKG